MPDTVLVVPCYNEANRLPQKGFREFAQAFPEVRLLFVDDGSQDETLGQLQNLKQDLSAISIVALPRNAGKAEAVRHGCLAAFELHPRCIGYWDADLATPLEVVHEFRAVFRRHPEVEIVFGARVRRMGSSIRRNPARHYLGRVFATAASLVLGLGVYDTQCGAKLFRASETMRETLRQPFLTRWLFDVEILARLIRRAEQAPSPPIEELVYELPLPEWQDVPGSKIQPSDFPRAFFELMRIYRAYLASGTIDSRAQYRLALSDRDSNHLARAA